MSHSKLSYNIMLLGKTGAGKSATGNTLLGRECFKTSLSFKSCTKYAVMESNYLGQIIVNVVDTPGIHDTNQDTAKTLTAIHEGISLISEGFNALLLVLKLGDRSTKELIETIVALKATFGDSYFEQFCIIALTHGDQDPDLSNNNIQEWCKNRENIEEGSELWTLMSSCDYRVVLFNNKEDDKREEVVRKLLSYLPPQAPRYTTELFRNCADARDAYVTSLGFPEQRAKIQTQLSLLEAEIDNSLNDNAETVDIVLLKLDDLRRTIEIESKGTKAMDDFKFRVYELKSKVQSLPEDEQERILALKEVKIAVNGMKVKGAASKAFAAVLGCGLGVETALTATGIIALAPGIGIGIALGLVTIGFLSYGIYALTCGPKSSKSKKEEEEMLLKKYH